MKSLLLIFLFINSIFLVPQSFAQNNQNLTKNEFERGEVVRIVDQGSRKIVDIEQPYQSVEVKLTTGIDKGKVVPVEHGAQATIKEYQLVKVGDEVVLSKLGSGPNSSYFIYDKFRIPPVLYILVAFFALVIVFSKLRGLASIIGMLISLLILLKFIVPSIAAGKDPVVVTLAGSFVIVFVSIFLAHGFYKRTAIAVSATVLSLIVAVLLSYVFVGFAHLYGTGSDDAYSLQFGNFANVNLRGLLLAGIIIGTLGVLDDITTSLAAAVEQISRANPKLNARELYRRGLAIGREHVTSLVNTLVLAYAGASLPVFLYFLAVKDTQPLWVTLNNELIIEETVRALVGSTALILAVPITTLAAAIFFGKVPKHVNANTKRIQK